MRASTSRLKPIAALRAATIATRIHPTVAPRRPATCRAASSAPASANGSANTEWLKRTNDSVGAQAVQAVQGSDSRFRFRTRLSRFSPAQSGSDRSPPHQIFFHIVDVPAGSATASSRARLARLDRAVVVVEAERARRPARVALSSSARGRHRRRQRAHRRQLGEDVQIGRARQAVGADRHLHAGVVEVARSAARRRRCGRCSAGR